MNGVRSQEIVLHTPGPWRWEINPKGRTIRLCGGARPLYDLIVMDFVRWGMVNAQPRFTVDGLMCKAEDFKRVAPNREHHAAWFQLLSHPDANLIAAAPDLLALAKKLAGECAECRGRGYTFSDDGITGFGPDDREPTREACTDCADIREVIAKAVSP